MIICFYLSGGSPSPHRVCLRFHIRVCAGALVGGYTCMYVRAKPRRLYIYMYVRACRVQRKTQCWFPGLHLFTLIFGQSLTFSWISLAWLAGWAVSPRNHSFHLPSAGVTSTCHRSWYFGVWGLPPAFLQHFPG